MRRESRRVALATWFFIVSAVPITAATPPWEEPGFPQAPGPPLFGSYLTVELRIDTPDGIFYVTTRDRQPITVRLVARDLHLEIQPIIDEHQPGVVALHVLTVPSSGARLGPLQNLLPEVVPARLGFSVQVAHGDLVVEVERIESSSAEFGPAPASTGDCCVGCSQTVICGCRVRSACGSCCGDCCVA